MSHPSKAPLEDRPHVVYRLYDERGVLLYIGLSVNYNDRVKQHRAETPWWSKVARVVLIEHPNRASAADAEREAIIGEHNCAEYHRRLGEMVTPLDRSKRLVWVGMAVLLVLTVLVISAAWIAPFPGSPEVNTAGIILAASEVGLFVPLLMFVPIGRGEQR